MLGVRPAIVVDAANVVGSVPDGWWKDRAGATRRLLERMAGLVTAGVPAAALDLPELVWFPDWTVVVEGRARSVAALEGIDLVRAEASGDDAIASEAVRLAAAGRAVTVVTSDRELAARVTAADADVRGARWLLDLLG
ncbi:MAG: NTP pyrophosphohydrolase [Propionibacteriaceae bacterium]|nr:NTP pyrophosphohydrolase [Propionibacteriaceae bacterium]